LETQIQKGQKYFKVISTQFQEDLIDALFTRLSVLTKEDLGVLGVHENYDFLIITELNHIRGIWKCTLRVIDIKSGVVKETISVESPLSKNLAKNTYQEMYRSMCTGEINININTDDANISIDGKSNKVEKTSFMKVLEIGQHELVIAKNGYRSYDTTIVIKPKERYDLTAILPEKGTSVKIDGTPQNSEIKISGRGQIIQKKFPFEGFLHEGRYIINISAPGYQTIADNLMVPEVGVKIVKNYNLLPFRAEKYYIHSLIVPGLGQIKMGYKPQGLIIFIAYSVLSSSTIYCQVRYSLYQSDIDRLFKKYVTTENNSEAARLHQEISNDQNRRNFYCYSRNVLMGLTLFVYSYNVIDMLYFKKGKMGDVKKKGFQPDEKIFDELKLNYSPDTGVGLSWNINFD